jgi:uncharacterized damage-inducible protein DinB
MTDFVQSQFRTLFAYHWHTTTHLLDCAARLDETAYHDRPGYGHGSIHDVLFHLLRTDQSWRLALETGKQLSPAQAESYPMLESLRAGFEQEQSAWRALLERYSATEIEGEISLTNWRGEIVVMPLWRVLQHLILHGMQHHAELAQLLTAWGQSPGNLDFIFFQ